MPQPCIASPVQIGLVTQLLALTPANSNADVAIHDSNLVNPPLIGALLAAGSSGAAAERLVDDCFRLKTTSLNNESNLPQTSNAVKVQNWASGNNPPFHRFSTTATRQWFDQLFTRVAFLAGHALSRIDLFHCHLIYRTVGPDVLAIFHAREYPADIEPNKDGQARGLDNGLVAFNTTAPAFRDRNPIWSASTGRVYVPHFQANTNPYRTLLGNPNLTVAQNPLFLDAVILGDCIADINTFPREHVVPFQKIWSVKAAMPTCNLCNFRHTEGSSTVIGRWHFCRQCQIFYCNTCGKWKLSRMAYGFARTRKCRHCPTETVLVD